ncbi:hypothetical protein JRO89_XS06G0176000 [Xanthoceras sorbifolium]|uniref:Gnk2-homologous domain-containing protein n=1 Tax=Xanthoceras sorbifolium TaxID=99658 RepID=A0ABQ8HYS3_9ROSI|nr:hypothetical protein JRO89_XS06G0176000 [Xanthoceras sorbifolium]
MSHSCLAKVELHRIGWSCERRANNTASARYIFNLSRLFSRKLYDEGGNSIYFTTTDGDDPDKVYGLYLCKGDDTKEICQTCISAAIDSLVQECQGTKAAIMWYEECLVRYSNRSLSSKFESQPAIIMSNPENVNVTDPVTLKNALNQSFTQLIANATSIPLKYATNVVNISSSVTLYTLGQCIPDLSKENCRVCLESAAGLLELEKNGSRYLYPSCNTRFELYPFFRNSSAEEPITPVQAPTPFSDKTGGADGRRNRKGSKAWIPIVATVSAVVVVVLLEEKADSQEIQLLHLRDGRTGNGNPYDTLHGENQFMTCITLQTWKLWCEEQTAELIDPVLVQLCDQVDLLKYIHIGLLCVQEDPADRPTMSSVVVMLASDNIKLPQPTQPAFSVGRKADKSSSDVKVVSVNEVTLSNVFPR